MVVLELEAHLGGAGAAASAASSASSLLGRCRPSTRRLRSPWSQPPVPARARPTSRRPSRPSSTSCTRSSASSVATRQEAMKPSLIVPSMPLQMAVSGPAVNAPQSGGGGTGASTRCRPGALPRRAPSTNSHYHRRVLPGGALGRLREAGPDGWMHVPTSDRARLLLSSPHTHTGDRPPANYSQPARRSLFCWPSRNRL